MDDPHHHKNTTSPFFLTKGSQVEVTSSSDGFTGAWYVATVINPPPPTSSPNHHARNNLVYVEYRDLLSENDFSGRLREYASVSLVRPAPVPDYNPPNFQLNDLVDAFYRDGWWTGVITNVVDADNFVVSFRNPNDEIQFRSSDLRIYRKWVGDRWVQPQKQGTTGWMFTVGKKVEVSFDRENLRDVWFPATILKNSGNSTFLVEYQQEGADNDVVVHKVTVDYHHIRPSPPHLRDKNFVLLEKVDAYYDFAWWSGLITKELADNRYIVFFKHTKKEREFIYSRVRPHLEWKGGKWFNTSQGDTIVRTTCSLIDNQIKQAPPIIGKKSPVTTSIMRRRPKIFDSNVKSSQRDKIINDGSSKKTKHPSVDHPEGFDSEVSGVTDQAFSKTENLSHGKKVHSKPGKGVELKTPTDYSRKRGRLINELKSLQATAKGSMHDPVKTRSQDIVENEDATKNFLVVVLGLQCIRTELLQEKIDLKLPNEKTQNVAKSDAQQPGVPQAASTVVDQERTEEETASVAPKRKRGRPPKLQGFSPETSVTVEAGQRKEVGLTTSPGTKSLEENQGPVNEQSGLAGKQNDSLISNKLPNENIRQDLNVQRDRGTKKYSSKKKRRGKWRTISINTESPVQDSHGVSKQKADGSLEKGSTRNLEASVGKSLVSDRLLSRSFEGKHSEKTVEQSLKAGEGGLQMIPSDMDSDNLLFVKTSPLWKTIESMEAFQMIPQNPHFRPLLEGVREGAREGLAIGTMVTFSTMVDKTCSLRFDDPRSTIEDCLETLVELENNGFDVEVVRERLTRLLLIKDKQEELENQSKGVVEKINDHYIQGTNMDKEIEEIDGQMRELMERKKHVLLKKGKNRLEVDEMEAVNEVIRQEIRKVGAEFDGLAAASFVAN
ncbi:hypothetical protein R6Q59_017257 [Mikania micrantha]